MPSYSPCPTLPRPRRGQRAGREIHRVPRAEVRPLEIAVGRAWWTANTTGRDEDFAAKVEAQNRLDQALANPRTVRRVESAPRPPRSADPLLRRQIDILYLIYLEKQVDPELLKRITATAERDRKGVQRLSGQGRRQAARR